MRTPALPLLLVLAMSGGLAAAEPAVAAGVKVVSEKNPDASSIETILATIIKPGMTDQQKCEAIFDYLVHRTYHIMEPEEPIGDALAKRKDSYESATVNDSIKILNVYGHSICYTVTWTVVEFFNAAGLYGRSDDVLGHTVPECKYGGSWHYYDVDMMGYVRRKDGSVPSVDQIKAEPALLTKTDQSPEYFWKYDGGGPGMQGCLKEGVKEAMYGKKISTHSMNLTLREGEALTRWFHRQWAPKYRYLHPYWSDSLYVQLLDKFKGEGPWRPETYFLFREARQARYGNWEMTYDPPLAKDAAMDGLYASTDVAHTAAAPFLRSADGKDASVTWHYFSPYGCAGNSADKQHPVDGAVITGEFATANGEVAYSLDLGRSWTSAHQGGGKFSLDLTPQLMGRYDWLVKLSFSGAGSGISAYRSVISGQCSPSALPFVDGKTTMTYTRDDTDCLLFDPDITQGEAELRRLAKVEGKTAWNDTVATHFAFADGKGGAVFTVEAPGDIVRVQTGAKFGCRAKSTLNAISFSIDDGKTWVVAAKQPVVGDEDHNEDHWNQSVDGILDFAQKKAYSLGCTPAKGAVRESPFTPKPTRKVLVKFSTEGGDGALSRIHGIYVLYRKPGALPLTITHRWTGGQHVEAIPADAHSKTYVVDGGPLDSNESIRIEAPAR